MTSSRIKLDRIASSTRNAHLSPEVTLGSEVISREGYVVAVRIKNEKYSYNTVENVHGRMVKLCRGDVLAGVLGHRRALKGYAGEVPDSLKAGDVIHVLNLGGVLGLCTAGNPELGPPFEAEVLGAILKFPDLGDRVGTPAHIFDGAVKSADHLKCAAPVLFVAGTCMNSGKTVAATEIIRTLSNQGLKIAACKMTGVSLMRDVLGMSDAGACEVVDFTDLGVATTGGADPVPVAKGMLNHLAQLNPDLIVAELGDGILGEYGVDALLGDKELMSAACCHVVCAPDPVAIYGAHRIYTKNFGLTVHAAAGPVTDNAVGRDYIKKNLSIPACNARHDIRGLADVVLKNLRGWEAAS